MEMLELLTFIIGMIGFLSSLYISAKTLELSKITNDVGLKMTSLSFIIFGAAVLIDSLSWIMPRNEMLMGRRWGWMRHPQVEELWLRPLIFVSLPLYVSSYTLYFAGLLASNACIFSLPALLIAYLFSDLAAVSILLAALSLSILKLNISGTKWMVFVGILFISHLLSGIGAFYAIKELLLVSTMLRSLAPTILTISR